MKQKTKKTVKKRFKLTAKGKVLRGHAYSSHLKRKKAKTRLRRQEEPSTLSARFAKKVKALLGG